MSSNTLSKAMRIMCDERHGRLHVRFRAVGNDLDPATGYLGQSRGHSNDSLGRCEATNGISKKLRTRLFRSAEGLRTSGALR